MVDWFKPASFADPELGALRRSKGQWRGTIVLGEARVPLVLAGSRAAPDPGALRIARSIPSDFHAWRPSLERALLEHFEPYADAIAAGDIEPGEPGVPSLSEPASVWLHAHAEFVRIAPLDGALTVEIGYRVAWDEEHTLGARLRDGRLVELCGSVLAP